MKHGQVPCDSKIYVRINIKFMKIFSKELTQLEKRNMSKSVKKLKSMCYTQIINTIYWPWTSSENTKIGSRSGNGSIRNVSNLKIFTKKQCRKNLHKETIWGKNLRIASKNRLSICTRLLTGHYSSFRLHLNKIGLSCRQCCNVTKKTKQVVKSCANVRFWITRRKQYMDNPERRVRPPTKDLHKLLQGTRNLEWSSWKDRINPNKFMRLHCYLKTWKKCTNQTAPEQRKNLLTSPVLWSSSI